MIPRHLLPSFPGLDLLSLDVTAGGVTVHAAANGPSPACPHCRTTSGRVHKGFDGDALRSACLARDVNPNIPLKANRDPDRWAWDPEGYKERNRVERLFGKAKQFRRFATRYEQLKVTFLGVAHLALGFVRLRRSAIVNTA